MTITTMTIMADTGLADREGPANPVDLVDRVDLEDRGSPVDLDTNRAAQDLGQSRALLARTAPSRAHLRRAVRSRAHLRRNLPDPDLTRARPRRMPVHLHLTQARLHQIPARLRAPTHPGVATHLPVRTRQAEAIHPVAATPVAATHPGEAIADTEGVIPHDCEFIWHSSGFGYCTQLCIKECTPMRTEGPHEKRRTVCRSNCGDGRGSGISRSRRCNRRSSSVGPVPAVVSR